MAAAAASTRFVHLKMAFFFLEFFDLLAIIFGGANTITRTKTVRMHRNATAASIRVEVR